MRLSGRAGGCTDENLARTRDIHRLTAGVLWYRFLMGPAARPNPIKILFLAAHPSDTTRLAVDQEVREIGQRLRAAPYGDRFELVQEGQNTRATMCVVGAAKVATSGMVNLPRPLASLTNLV